jgi:endonuclease YncB( thermonuclease family)
MASSFAAGCVVGGIVVLTVQSRPAPASVPGAPADARSAIASSAPARGGTHPAEVLRVIDGDTFEARVRVWPGLDITTKIRLRGIDAPELKAHCPGERAMAEAARDALRDMLAEGTVGISAIARQIWRPRRRRCGDPLGRKRLGRIAGERLGANLWRRPPPRLVRRSSAVTSAAP